MIESILGDLFTVFLDILIFKSFNPKVSKKRQIIRSILILLIFVVYLTIFALSLFITISSIQFDKTLAIKMGVVTTLLLLILVVFGIKIYNQWKQSRSSN